MPIHDSPSNPRPIGQFQFRSHTNLPIHYQSISPMPILDQSSNLIPTLDQSLTNPPKRCNPCPIPNQVANFDSYANPIPICQSNANLPILIPQLNANPWTIDTSNRLQKFWPGFASQKSCSSFQISISVSVFRFQKGCSLLLAEYFASHCGIRSFNSQRCTLFGLQCTYYTM